MFMKESQLKVKSLKNILLTMNTCFNHENMD
mgnify:CR=1 FL=1